jgi:hypothetical protein
MRRLMVILCSVGLLLTVLAPVAVARPMAFTMDSEMQTGAFPEGYNTGTFVQTGPGSPLLCWSGDVVDTRYVIGAPRSDRANWAPNGISLVADKTFSCNESDSISLRLQIHGVFATEWFTWVIIGGTGAYSGLNGEGSGWTEGCGESCVVNHYMGTLR